MAAGGFFPSFETLTEEAYDPATGCRARITQRFCHRQRRYVWDWVVFNDSFITIDKGTEESRDWARHRARLTLVCHYVRSGVAA